MKANVSGSMLVIVAVSALLALPLSVSAAMIPFGGQVTMPIFCKWPPGAIFTVIKPAGASPVNQIWLPTTRTYSYGPPRSPGQWLLGLDIAMGQCVVSFKPYIAFPGMYMQMLGSSK